MADQVESSVNACKISGGKGTPGIRWRRARVIQEGRNTAGTAISMPGSHALGNCLALATLAGLSIGEWHWGGVRATVVMLMSLGIIVVLISLLHLDRFKSPLALLVWFVLFATEALIFGGLLLVRQVRPAMKGAPL